jgi:hypothetical protein
LINPEEKKQEPSETARLKKRKRRRLWLLVDLGASLTVTAIMLILLLHRPVSYDPTKPTQTKEANTYWTHVVMPKIYNGAQEQKPFDLEISEEGINRIVADSGWPKISEGAVFSEPQVKFTADGITLMGTATIENVNFIVTMVGKPVIDESGLLNLNISAFKVGALNVTPLAKVIARKMYAQHLADVRVNAENLNAKVLNSLFYDKPFEPVFAVDDKKIKIAGITTEQGKLTIRFVNAGGRKAKK